MVGFWRAAAFAAFFFPGVALAQDVTLTSRDGSLAVAGTLQGYDGEFYRISSTYGPLTIDAQGVICDGPACPDLMAPKAMIRFVGESDAGHALLPPLVAAFAKTRGLVYTPQEGETPALLTDPATDKVLAEISFRALPREAAHDALKSGAAELLIASVTEPDFGTRTVAADVLLPIVAPDSDLQRALAERLGHDSVAAVTHPDLASLADAVAKDPWAIAMTGRAVLGAAHALPLSDSCGFPLLPTDLAVKAGDYPLTLPVYLLTPRRRLPLMAREFLDFLPTPAAQKAIASAAYIDRIPERQPMTADGLRLINAIQGAGEETTLADLKRLVDLMDGADRYSLTFRFQDGTSALDTASQESLRDLALLLEAGVFRNQALTLAGFSDGSGAAKANLDLSLNRAAGVLAALKQLAPSVAEGDLPQVVGFGEALPMACDETAAGRRLNRRVELWLKPSFKPAEVAKN